MNTIDSLDILYITCALLFQAVLIAHFAIRKRNLEKAVRWGPVAYALSIPVCLASILLLLNGKPWYFWLGGFLYLAWAGFGYMIEYVRKNQDWRSPFQWSIGAPYLSLYLATVMFFWWPLLRIWKPLWYAGAIMFLVSTILNTTSHSRRSEKPILLDHP
jgi:hypothetical protein